MLKKTAQKGFTIVELLIVIVVIGILAALVLNTFNGVQARARDTERQTDVNSIATQLEVYYNDNGQYPTLANLKDDSWVQSNLKGIDMNATKAPGQSSNSITDTAAPTKDQYGYKPVEADGTTACTNADAATACAKYKLYYHTENDNANKEKDSLN